MNIRNRFRLALLATQAIASAACGANSDRDATERVTFAAQPSQGTVEAQAATRGPAPVQTIEIMDPAGFGQPMIAATVDIPGGWRAEGGAGWNRTTNCVTNQLQLAWRAMSRDGDEAVEILPGFNWQVQGTEVGMNPCPAAPFASTRDFLQAVVQQKRPGARVLQYRDRPDLASATTSAAGSAAQVRQEAGQILIAYAHDGRDFRETLSTTVTFSNLGGNVVAGTGMVFAHRAPSGALDFALGERIAASMRPNRQWLDMMNRSGSGAIRQYSELQHSAIEDWNNREMARINARGAAERAAISANTLRDVAAINAETHADTVATNDHIEAQNLEAIGEYSRYRGTDGGEVRSSIHVIACCRCRTAMRSARAIPISIRRAVPNWSACLDRAHDVARSGPLSAGFARIARVGAGQLRQRLAGASASSSDDAPARGVRLRPGASDLCRKPSSRHG
jgi:hypothetical protein